MISELLQCEVNGVFFKDSIDNGAAASKAAEILGIDRKTLYNKMKQINVE